MQRDTALPAGTLGPLSAGGACRHLDLAADGLGPARLDDLRACPYGRHAVLTLHFAQEEEAYFFLTAGAPVSP